MADCIKRLAEIQLADKLETMGAVLVEGPKYCGKTTLSDHLAVSAIYMAEPETRPQNLMMAQTNPSPPPPRRRVRRPDWVFERVKQTDFHKTILP